MTTEPIGRMLRLHLSDWAQQGDFVGAIDQRVRHRYGRAAVDAVSSRAEALLAHPPTTSQGHLATPEGLTVMAAVANVSLVVDGMPPGSPVAQELSRFVDDAVAAYAGPDDTASLLADGSEKFAATIELADLSAALSKSFRDWSLKSPLAQVRKRLGIAGPEQERPFGVRVIEADTAKTDVDIFDDYRPGDRAVANEVALREFFPEGTPAAWVSSFDDESTVMNLRQSTALYLLAAYDEGSVAFNEVDVPLLGHEYTHTQRSLRINAPLPLGRLFDEVFATDCARGTSYWSEARLLDIVSMPTSQGLRQLAMSHAPSGDSAAFYREASESVGLTGFALLACHRPKNYCQVESLEIPLGHSATRERAIVDAVLFHRLGHDGPTQVKAVVEDNLERFLRKFPGRLENDLVDDHLDFRLPAAYQAVFEKIKAEGRVDVPFTLTDAIGVVLRRAAASSEAVSLG